jgi:branched-chain amino acid transport system permease protein
MLGTAALGVVIERLVYKPVRQAPRVSAIITALGVGIFLENFTLALSPYPQQVPALIPSISWNFGGFSISALQVLIIALSLVLMGALEFVVHHTLLGMGMRAIAWDKNAAQLVGVPLNRVISCTFAIGAGLGGVAGMLYALAFPVIDPYMGVLVGWKAFISAVVGGIGNIRGAVLGGFILAGIEIAVAASLPSTYRDFIAFGLLLLALIARPCGILGRPVVQKV